jgi:peroxiredoxin
VSDDTLKHRLEAQLQADRSSRSSEELAGSEAGVARAELALRASTVPAVGDRAPGFELPNVGGEQISLASLLRRGPAVVTFYRGGWCPYCNLQLRAYQAVLSKIERLGGQLVAISPQLPDHSLTTAERNELGFEVLSDVGNVVAGRYGLVFQVVEGSMRELERLDDVNGDDARRLPVPGTFVINGKGRVEYAFVDPEYRHRAEPDDVVAAVAAVTAVTSTQMR